MIQKLKRPARVAAGIGILLGIGIIAFAISSWFSSIGTQTSDFKPKVYFEFETNDFFTADGEIGPGESKSINPIVTSNSSIPSYVVFRVVMPLTSSSEGLYNIESGSAWSLVESGVVDGQWVEVYLYSEALAPEASTSPLGPTVTMKEIGMSEYASLEDLNISMSAYAVGTDDEEMENAWKDIKAHYGL